MKSDISNYIDKAIFQIQKYIDTWHLYDNHELKKDWLNVLVLMRDDICKNGIVVNIRLLRGFKDICTATAIQYEHTEFNEPVFKIYNELERNNQDFKNLELLGMDFGKGDPI